MLGAVVLGVRNRPRHTGRGVRRYLRRPGVEVHQRRRNVERCRARFFPRYGCRHRPQRPGHALRGDGILGRLEDRQWRRDMDRPREWSRRELGERTGDRPREFDHRVRRDGQRHLSRARTAAPSVEPARARRRHVIALAIDPTRPSPIYAGTAGDGVFRLDPQRRRIGQQSRGCGWQLLHRHRRCQRDGRRRDRRRPHRDDGIHPQRGTLRDHERPATAAASPATVSSARASRSRRPASAGIAVDARVRHRRLLIPAGQKLNTIRL